MPFEPQQWQTYKSLVPNPSHVINLQNFQLLHKTQPSHARTRHGKSDSFLPLLIHELNHIASFQHFNFIKIHQTNQIACKWTSRQTHFCFHLAPNYYKYLLSIINIIIKQLHTSKHQKILFHPFSCFWSIVGFSIQILVWGSWAIVELYIRIKASFQVGSLGPYLSHWLES
jgi:hypothetical protein